MTLNVLTGDLLDFADQGLFHIIVHGCNCFHAMGSGIAKQIANKYPAAKTADDRTKYGDSSKLGFFSQADITSHLGKRFTIINAYTQFRWSGKQDVFEYEKFDDFLLRLAKISEDRFLSTRTKTVIGFPKIGCGYAKGDEPRILSMLRAFEARVGEYSEVYLVVI